MTRLVTHALSAPIHFYRRFLSPLMPPACRFQPSCSAYALEAIKTHGPARGLWLAARQFAICVKPPHGGDLALCPSHGKVAYNLAYRQDGAATGTPQKMLCRGGGPRGICTALGWGRF